MSNIEGIREYRAACDAAEGVAMAEALRAALLAHVASGEMTEEHYLAACAEGLDEIRERAGSDAGVHARKAKRLMNSLVQQNYPLAVRIARRELKAKARVEANLEEAAQEGAIGLMRAIQVFDESRGSSFATCAGFWIRHHVQNCIVKQGDFEKQRPAKMPPRTAKAANRFRLTHGREPTAEELGVDPAAWARWNDTARMVSLDKTSFGFESDEPRMDERLVDENASPDAVLSSADLTAKIQKEMAASSPRNRALIHALFVGGRSLEDVSTEFGLSVTRIHQLKVQLEKRLRKVLAA